MKNKNVLYLTQAAMIAALYVVLTMIANALGIASGNIQVRFSEALTVLPFLTPAAVPGLFIGCLLANLLNPLGINLLDVIFGSLTTLLAGLLTARCKNRRAPSGARQRFFAGSARSLLTLRIV